MKIISWKVVLGFALLGLLVLLTLVFLHVWSTPDEVNGTEVSARPASPSSTEPSGKAARGAQSQQQENRPAASKQPAGERAKSERNEAARETGPKQTAGGPAKQPDAKKEPADQLAHQQRELLIGTWEDNYQGHRTMTLKEDGTGTMVVKLSGMKARLFAKRLEFEMVWSVEQGRLHKRTIGGTPQLQVNMILKSMGDRVEEPILELTEERLVLLDQDGETRYRWRRVENG
jgi:hypothetical protein